MKKSICIFGLAAGFSKNVAQRVSNRLEMYFACVEDLIEFDLINSSEVKKICGADYLKKIERKKVREATSFENTIVYLNFTLLNDEVNLEHLKKNCVMVYIALNEDSFEKKIRRDKLSKLERILSLGVFKDRDKLLKQHADVIVDCSHTLPEKSATRVKNTIFSYYEERL